MCERVGEGGVRVAVVSGKRVRGQGGGMIC